MLFTYTVGLSSGPTFAAGLKGGRAARESARSSPWSRSCRGRSCSGLGLRGRRLGPARRGGAFAGALTNTPALGSVIEHTTRGGHPRRGGLFVDVPGWRALAALLAAHLAPRGRRRLSRVPLPAAGRDDETLTAWTVPVNEPELARRSERYATTAVASRSGNHARDGRSVRAATDDRVPTPGDLITVVRTPRNECAAFADADR